MLNAASVRVVTLDVRTPPVTESHSQNRGHHDRSSTQPRHRGCLTCGADRLRRQFVSAREGHLVLSARQHVGRADERGIRRHRTSDDQSGAHDERQDPHRLGWGLSLYLFTVDKDASSSCYDQCATNWPPVLTTGAPAGTGVDDGLLGTTKRSAGTVQVTYNKAPLYRFAKDTHPGWVKGQGVKNTWWLVSADGAAVKTKS